VRKIYQMIIWEARGNINQSINLISNNHKAYFLKTVCSAGNTRRECYAMKIKRTKSNKWFAYIILGGSGEQPTNQSINRSINQQVNKSINQSNNQIISKFISQSTDCAGDAHRSLPENVPKRSAIKWVAPRESKIIIINKIKMKKIDRSINDQNFRRSIKNENSEDVCWPMNICQIVQALIIEW
jgi:hypothetical protein